MRHHHGISKRAPTIDSAQLLAQLMKLDVLPAFSADRLGAFISPWRSVYAFHPLMEGDALVGDHVALLCGSGQPSSRQPDGSDGTRRPVRPAPCPRCSCCRRRPSRSPPAFGACPRGCSGAGRVRAHDLLRFRSTHPRRRPRAAPCSLDRPGQPELGGRAPTRRRIRRRSHLDLHRDVAHRGRPRGRGGAGHLQLQPPGHPRPGSCSSERSLVDGGCTCSHQPCGRRRSFCASWGERAEDRRRRLLVGLGIGSCPSSARSTRSSWSWRYRPALYCRCGASGSSNVLHWASVRWSDLRSRWWPVNAAPVPVVPCGTDPPAPIALIAGAPARRRCSLPAARGHDPPRCHGGDDAEPSSWTISSRAPSASSSRCRLRRRRAGRVPRRPRRRMGRPAATAPRVGALPGLPGSSSAGGTPVSGVRVP